MTRVIALIPVSILGLTLSSAAQAPLAASVLAATNVPCSVTAAQIAQLGNQFAYTTGFIRTQLKQSFDNYKAPFASLESAVKNGRLSCTMRQTGQRFNLATLLSGNWLTKFFKPCKDAYPQVYGTSNFLWRDLKAYLLGISIARSSRLPGAAEPGALTASPEDVGVGLAQNRPYFFACLDLLMSCDVSPAKFEEVVNQNGSLDQIVNGILRPAIELAKMDEQRFRATLDPMRSMAKQLLYDAQRTGCGPDITGPLSTLVGFLDSARTTPLESAPNFASAGTGGPATENTNGREVPTGKTPPGDEHRTTI
jgi:hypothetical protein